MITAIDTSVLLDVLGADPEFGPRSADALRRCLAEGSLIACEVVWAETEASFGASPDAEAAFAGLRIGFSALDTSISLAAGEVWRALPPGWRGPRARGRGLPHRRARPGPRRPAAHS